MNTFDHKAEYDAVLQPAINALLGVAKTLEIPLMVFATLSKTEAGETVSTSVESCGRTREELQTFSTLYAVAQDDDLYATVRKALDAWERLAALKGLVGAAEDPASPTV